MAVSGPAQIACRYLKHAGQEKRWGCSVWKEGEGTRSPLEVSMQAQHPVYHLDSEESAGRMAKCHCFQDEYRESKV